MDQFQFHPDIDRESAEKNAFEAEPRTIYVGADGTAYSPSSGQALKKKKNMKGAGKKILTYLLILVLAAGGGFGGALAAVYFAPGIIPQKIEQNDIAIKTDTNINTAEAIAEKVIPSVVGISSTVEVQQQNQPFPQSWEDLFRMPSEGQSEQSASVGTGLIFTEDGYILTNSHVVLDGEASKVIVQLAEGKEVEGKVLWSDKSSDLAIVKVEEKNLTPAVLGDSEDMKVGSYVVAIGNPLGLAFDRSASQGIISGLSRTITVETGGEPVRMEGLLQTDASINGGNSGGPLCNSKGEVIGINTAKAQSGEGLGFAIPINIAKPIVEEIIKTGEFERSYMGVTAISVQDILEANPQVDLGTKTGACIQQIYTGSPAATAGMKEGDVILAINDQEVETVSQMIKDLFAYRPGDEITVKVMRDKKALEVKVVLAEMIETNEY